MGIVLYFLIGMGYKRIIMGAQGPEQIPNYALWLSCWRTVQVICFVFFRFIFLLRFFFGFYYSLIRNCRKHLVFEQQARSLACNYKTLIGI